MILNHHDRRGLGLRPVLFSRDEILSLEKAKKELPPKNFSNSPVFTFKSYALSTLPDFRQDVHTYIFLAPPLTLTFTDLTLDFHILLERLCEWLTLFPK